MTYLQVIYDDTGKIIRSTISTTESSFVAPDEVGEHDVRVSPIPASYELSRFFVANGQVVEKQPLNLPGSLQITADGTDEAVISGIPAGVTVTWPDGQVDEVPDGEVRFSVDLPGTYTLVFDAVPYLRQEVTIEAVAAT